MSDKNEVSYNGGAGFVGLLTILFIGLKLTGHIAWSWWWVLSPIWITFGVVFSFFLLALLVLWIMDK